MVLMTQLGGNCRATLVKPIPKRPDFLATAYRVHTIWTELQVEYRWRDAVGFDGMVDHEVGSGWCVWCHNKQKLP
jgi:hypothetical protein